jgi:acyl-CoA synthetase (AMP-forming)/AMP-acid ligase II
VPNIEGSVGGEVHMQAEKFRDKEFVVFGDVASTYGAFERESNRVALGFEERQLGGGTTVCVLLPNCLEFLLTFVGLAKVGAITVAINTLSGIGPLYRPSAIPVSNVSLERSFAWRWNIFGKTNSAFGPGGIDLHFGNDRTIKG